VKILVGDILKSNAQTLINTVNTVGVMGKGIALEYKNRFPDMFKDYQLRCERGKVKVGIPYLYRTLFPPQIINFPTKDHWKSLSKLDDIQKGLQFLLAHYKEWDVQSLAIPPLGCGNGQLEWRVVGPVIYKFARQLDIPVEMFAPYGTPPSELTEKFLDDILDQKTSNLKGTNGQSSLNAAWVAIVEILNRIEQQPYHWPVGRTMFQKLAYVATEEGLPTNLQYRRGSFGPFSPDLKKVEATLINNGLVQEERAGNMFRVKVGPNYKRIREKFIGAIELWESLIDKTVDLFLRVNTDQAERIATVLFASREMAARGIKFTEVDILRTVMEWKQKRRPPLDENEVASTIRNLGVLGWLDAAPSPDLPVSADETLIDS
jgi:O-acetyl-ADP-ribose deacetylase (regulator of RNase III)/uncharacterized protein YwgA